jgi:putative transposase
VVFKPLELSSRRHTRLSRSAYEGRAVLLTICTYQRRPLFGVVIADTLGSRVELTVIGDIVRQEWVATGGASDAMVVMPDHVHGIVHARGRVISEFVRGLKSSVTSRVWREVEDDASRVWQRGYHDRILRDGEMSRARTYIANNPIAWHL